MEKIDSSPMTLTRWFIKTQRKYAPNSKGNLTVLLSSIQLACKSISNNCNKAGIFDLYGISGTINASKDKVKKLDVLSNEIMINSLSFTEQVCIMASEENEKEIVVKDYKGNYCCVFDPLDGSSNIDANVSVGTIFGIYQASKDGNKEDLLQKGTNLVAAGYCMYGSATMMVLSVGHGVYGFTLDISMGEFVLTHPNIKIPKESKQIYSVNEGNSQNWDAAIKTYVNRCHNPKKGEPSKSLRYIGSMVADVHRTLIYGGIFMYPADKKSPNGKLRLVYECNPMAFLIEQAGGKASTGKERILDIKPTEIHERKPILLGTDYMVSEVEELYKKI